MNIDGYPDENELNKIENWKDDWDELFKFIKERWKFADC